MLDSYLWVRLVTLNALEHPLPQKTENHFKHTKTTSVTFKFHSFFLNYFSTSSQMFAGHTSSIQYFAFLVVPWQLYRFPCHSLLHIVKKHYHRALWETCDPWDMLSEWLGDKDNDNGNRRNEMGGVRVERTRHMRWAPLARVWGGT